jgi:hypothetical protein
VPGLFYLLGTTDSLGSGRDNRLSPVARPSTIYIADGVTDSGLAVSEPFSAVILGTGITMAFIKEVQVKRRFKAVWPITGRNCTIVPVRSNEYHGAIYGYATPKRLSVIVQNRRFPRFSAGVPK